MGIYISDIEMPKRHSYITITIWSDGVASYGLFDRDGKLNDFKDIKITSVQPHGRLIDADVLAEKHRELAYELRGANYDFHMTACSWVNSAPTIIPAEEETE